MQPGRRSAHSSGATSVHRHREPSKSTGAAPAPLPGSKFHTNDIEIVRCEDRGTTGPGQPGGKKGLLEDTLLFTCTGSFNGVSGHTCEGFLQDGGEPAGKRGNDPDRIEMVVKDSDGVEVARCDGDLEGGNVQIHPPVGP